MFVYVIIFRTLIISFSELLVECGKQVTPKSVVFFIDDIDLFTNSHAMQWLSDVVPKVGFISLLNYVVYATVRFQY